MQQDLTEGSVARKLIMFATPIVIGMLFHTAYNIIDAIYIGMLGPLELAAVSLTFPVIFIFIAFANGLDMGATALISQAIGRKDIAMANNVAEHAVVLGAVLGAAIAILGILYSPVLFVFMGADEQVLALTIEYSVPIFIGIIFMFTWFVSDSILKAQGNSKTPMKNLAISVVINIILNPILIFGIGPVPALGLFGAAIATVFSRVLAAVLNFYYIYAPKSVISLAMRYFKPRWSVLKRIVLIGLPASASQTLGAGGFMLLTAVVGGFGSLAIAAFGIGLRLNSVVMLPIIGMMTAVMAFVGQNVGAGNLERAKQVTKLASKITFLISLAISIPLFLFPDAIFGIFTQEPEIINIGRSYLSIMPLMYLLFGSYFVIIGAFNGTGKTHYMLATNAIFWAITIGLAYYLSTGMGLEGVWIAWVIAAMVEIVLVNAIFYSGLWLKGSKQQLSAAGH